jgi:adenylyltransferase/sulfurtransferase
MSDQRYSRQVLFAGIGVDGQRRLAASSVLLVGCGALGSVIAEILVRAGIGRLTIADRDYVDESNLQRQSLFTESDCSEGLPKATAAVRHLSGINRSVNLVERVADVRSANVEELIQGQDIILDGTDNFETRYLLNDASLKWNIPWTYGACVGAYGMCMTIVPRVTPCLRCVLQHVPPPGSSPTCDTSGIIGPVVHLVAGFETAEALKLLTGRLDRINRKLTTVDLWENRMSSLDLSRLGPDSECAPCGRGDYEFLRGEHEGRAYALCGRNAVQIWSDAGQPVDFQAIAQRLAALAAVTYNNYLMRATFGQFEIALFRDGRGIIRGTQDIDEARSIYSKFVGN